MSILGSILRISVGYLIGCAAGMILGVLSYFIRALNVMFSPLMTAIKAAPVASFILLALLWLKPVGVPILISAIMVAPIVYGNVYSGLEAHSRELREVAFVYGMSRRQCASYLFIPSVSPYLSAACATSFGLAWKAGVAAEVLCLTPSSIGLGIYVSKLYLETPELFAWTATVVLLSLLLEKAVKQLVKLPKYALARLKAKKDRPSTDIPLPNDIIFNSLRTNNTYTDTAPTGGSDRSSDRSSGDITVSGLYKSYGDETVISDLSAHFKSGSRTAIMGASGCGKTTLLRIISGLESADIGEVTGGGGSLAIVFQEARCFETLSALGNVSAVYTKRADVAAHLLRKLGFSDTDMQKKPHELSGGMQRRVAVARALCYCIRLSEEGRSPTLLLDEAVRELDADTARLTQELIFKIASATECTVISVTHDRSEAERLYDTTVSM